MHVGMFQDSYDPGTLNSEVTTRHSSVGKYSTFSWNPYCISLCDLSRIALKMIKHRGQRNPGLSLTGEEPCHLDLLPSGLQPMQQYSRQVTIYWVFLLQKFSLNLKEYGWPHASLATLSAWSSWLRDELLMSCSKSLLQGEYRGETKQLELSLAVLCTNLVSYN